MIPRAFTLRDSAFYAYSLIADKRAPLQPVPGQFVHFRAYFLDKFPVMRNAEDRSLVICQD